MIETLKILSEVIHPINYYGGFILTAFLLFRYQKNSLWWCFFGFMLVDSGTTIWMNFLAKQGINNWHITDWGNGLDFALIGWLLISVPYRTKIWTWAWGFCSVSLLFMVLLKDPKSHWSTQVENAMHLVFAGAAVLRYIKQDTFSRLLKVGLFWIVIGQFFLKSVQLVVMAIYSLVHLSHDEVWSQLIMTLFNVFIMLYMFVLMYGGWHFRNR